MPRTWKRTTEKGSWSEETLKNAIKSIEDGKSIRAASKYFKIPFSTLQERIKKGVTKNPHLGRNATFTSEQETELANRVKLLADMFYGITPNDIRRTAFDFAERNQIPHRFSKEAKLAGKDWFEGFLKRNPGISVRKPEATSVNRITGFNREAVDRFYNNLQSLQEKYKFTPDRIYNCDETGITTVQEPSNIVAPKGKKRVGSVTSWERGKLVTVLCTMSAAGSFIPPMFIYPRQRMSPQLKKDGPPCAIYEVSPKGWINEKLFVVWLQHFINHSNASVDKPVLLILDNHGSHISLDSYQLCKANGVSMLSIPPHCSHRLQPLDVTFYSTLKAAFRRECDLLMKSQGLKRITPYDLAGLFNVAYSRVATMAVGISGFKTTGIFPLNPNTFTDDDFLAADRFCSPADTTLPTMEDSEAVESRGCYEIAMNTPIEVANPIRAEEDENTSKTETGILGTVKRPGTSSELQSISDHQSFPMSSIDNPQPSCSFHDILQLPPKPTTCCTKKTTRNKQCSEILTSTPQKAKLELAIATKKENELKKEIAQLKKANKNLQKSFGNVKPKTSSASKNKSLKQKISIKKEKITTGKIGQKTMRRKNKPKMETDSEEEEPVDEKYLCDDNEMDDLPGAQSEETCFICGEFGRDQEEWFRCTLCGLWAHSLCSGEESAEGYICDHCSKIRKP